MDLWLKSYGRFSLASTRDKNRNGLVILLLTSGYLNSELDIGDFCEEGPWSVENNPKRID